MTMLLGAIKKMDVELISYEDQGNNIPNRDSIYTDFIRMKMNELFIDDNAIPLIKRELANQKADAVRIFTSGGCCKRFEITPVKKALAGDAAFVQGGIKVYVEKELAESTSAIEIKFDEEKGLIIELHE